MEPRPEIHITMVDSTIEVHYSSGPEVLTVFVGEPKKLFRLIRGDTLKLPLGCKVTT